MNSLYSWSKLAGNNSNSDPAIAWPEGQTPGSVNNSSRAGMGRVAEFRDDITGALTASGTANGIVVTANSAFATLANGRLVAFIATADNTGPVNLNVNSLGAKPVRIMTTAGDTALVGGEIQGGGTYVCRYNASLNGGSGGWQLMSPSIGTAAFKNVTDFLQPPAIGDTVQPYSFVRVGDFGAVGDDTNEVAKLQAAINKADIGNGRAVRIDSPISQFAIKTTGLTISGDIPVTLYGEGQPEVNTTYAGAALTIGTGPTTHQGFVSLRDFKLWGDSGSVTGIKGNYCANLELEGLSVYLLGTTGIHLDNCYSFRMDRTQIADCGTTGLKLTGASMNGAVISRSKFLNHAGAFKQAVDVDGTGSGEFHYGGLITGCAFELNSVGLRVRGISGLVIEGSYFEANSTRHILVPAGGAVDTLVVRDNQFLGTGSVEFNDVNGLELDNLVFYGSGQVLTINNCTNVKWGRLYFPGGGTIGGTNLQKREYQQWREWVAYTPTWSAPTPPSLGNGSIEAAHHRVGNTVKVRMTLSMGSTTTYGAGGWTFTLPFQARNTSGAFWMGQARFLDASGPTGALTLAAVVEGNSSVFYVQNAADLTSVSASAPIAWAVGDQLYVHFEYECA